MSYLNLADSKPNLIIYVCLVYSINKDNIYYAYYMFLAVQAQQLQIVVHAIKSRSLQKT